MGPYSYFSAFAIQDGDTDAYIKSYFVRLCHRRPIVCSHSIMFCLHYIYCASVPRFPELRSQIDMLSSSS